jgi:SAM-dependent methyltransferase
MSEWGQGAAYDGYIGRWSRLVAERFVDWLDAPAGAAWLDVGCGTGALSSRIFELARPASVTGIDASAAYVDVARARLGEDFDAHVGDATTLPFEDDRFDAVVSALLLNFLADPERAIQEQRRVSRGIVAAYVWDYAEGMQMVRLFWDATGEPDRDEGALFPLAREDALRRLFVDAGLADVQTAALEVPTVFRDFDDLWTPFLAGQGPAGAYAVALAPPERDELRERLRARLEPAPDGSIALSARAWAVKGRAAGEN